MNYRSINILICLIYMSVAFVIESCKFRQCPDNDIAYSIPEAKDTQSLHVEFDFSSLVNYDKPLEKVIDSLNIRPSDLHIEILKSKYLLELRSDTCLVKQYPIVLGGNPVDEKLIQGDMCTPEGTFKIVTKYPHNVWSRFILFDYPNEESLRKFNSAKQSGQIPQDASPGGAVGIHGVPQFCDYAIDTRQNWTLGCVSLKNKDIIEMYDFISIGSEVKIRH